MDCLKRRLLNKSLVILTGLCVISYSLGIAEELKRAKVTGDKVNVRVRPDVNSEIVTQLSLGEDVVILERQEEWTRIKAPSHSKCWINNECVSGAIIKTDSTNLRCGPGIAFPVLAKLEKGTKVNIIEIFGSSSPCAQGLGEWIRIEPPVEFGVWVNSKYIESEKLKEEVAEKKEAEEIITEPVIEQKPQIISVPEKEIAGVELVSCAGRLEDLGIIINRPGTYKLISEEGKWLCIIKSPTLDLNPYINRVVRIEGVVLAKSSSWNVPVIEAKRLQVVK